MTYVVDADVEVESGVVECGFPDVLGEPAAGEPLLRLNVEGPNVEAMSGVRDEALTVIRATNSTTGVPDHAYRA